jgi:hypothetical protein
MNKKTLIIIFTTATTLVVIASVIFYFVSHKPSDSQKDTTSPIYIEKGFESISKPIKSAIEAYANQDRSESTSKRNERLKKYFSGDSPVYSHKLQNISSSVKKSSAEITSIFPNNSEAGIKSVDVCVEMTYYFNSNEIYVSPRTYWISYKQAKGGSIKAYDIGLY